MSNVNMNTQSWTDPKEAIVSLNGLINMVQKLQNNTRNDANNTYENTSLVQNNLEMNTQNNLDIDERNCDAETRNETPNKRTRNLMDNDLIYTHSPKNQRIHGGFGNSYQYKNNKSIIIRNSNHHRRDEIQTNNEMNIDQNHQASTTNNRPTVFNHYDINEQSISYSVDTHLPPIVIECQPKLKSKENATKLVTAFINYIEKDFRKQYPNHTRPIGFDYWWQDNDGARISGIVKDVDLFVYLCDAKRYPAKLENFSIKSDPPKRLPPQFTVVIKFVNNNIEIDDLRETLKNKYNSTFTVENMLGGIRMNNRHVRVDFGDKKDYESILNSGVVGVQGQLFDVDEYLPAPKILICTKCIIPGHTKKQCQSSIERCRRCGGDRQDCGDHKSCQIKCQHCGSTEHCSNDYRCPSLLDFRRRIISELRQKPNCLPAQVQFFIPADCRPIGNTARILSNTVLKTNKENQISIGNKGATTNKWPSLPVSDARSEEVEQMINKQSEIENKILDFSKDLVELKEKYVEDQRKIEQRFQEQLKNIQNGWLAIQNQVATQNEMISTTYNLINDVLFDSCENVMNMMVNILQEIKIKTKSEEEKKKFESLDSHLKLVLLKLNDKKQSYLKFQEQLNQLTLQQHKAASTIMNSLFTSNNE